MSSPISDPVVCVFMFSGLVTERVFTGGCRPNVIQVLLCAETCAHTMCALLMELLTRCTVCPGLFCLLPKFHTQGVLTLEP
jgi:hypothetical protein